MISSVGGTSSNKISPDNFGEVKMNYESVYLIFMGDETLHDRLVLRCNTSLTATAGSKKLTSQTKHIPALCRCRDRESVPTQKSNHIGGSFRDHHFCLYFEIGCELGPSEAQTQNTSKNDDLENGLIFLFDFCVGTDS